MISKLYQEKKSQEKSQFMFQICVPNQKVKGKVAMCHIPYFLYKNAMIRNIKIHNIIYIIKISKSMEGT